MRESGQSFRGIERLSSVGFALPPEVQAALSRLGRQMAAPSAALSHFAKEWRQTHDQLATWASELPAWAIIEARKVLAAYVVDASGQLVPEEGEVLFGDIPSVNAEGEESEFEDSIEDEKLPSGEERRRTLKAVRQQATPTERKILNAWEA